MKVLIIDDELNICLTLKTILEDEDYECFHALDDKKGIELFETENPDLVLLDVKLEDANGLDVLEKLKEMKKEVIVIMISGHSGIKEAVRAIKLGAYDFLEKPLSLSKVKLTVKKAIEFKNISTEYKRLKSNEDKQYEIIGESQKIIDLENIIQKVAPTDSKVLIRGESGTGKELVAYAIHKNSKRKNKPFIKFNSAAIPSELVESELFGYEKGAFTGAARSKEGKIEQADKGTLFLDEIGDMGSSAQAKILRVIQEGEFERVGGNKTQKIDVRLLAATHKNLEKMVENGQFREDLFYRLNVIPIKTPPLRKHPEDIPILISHFSKHFSEELTIPEKKFSPAVINELQSWQFKGNVRELKNLMERIYILVGKIVVELEDLKIIKGEIPKTEFWNQTLTFKEKKKEFEIKYLSTQLKMHEGSISRTAEALELQVSNLSRKLKELKIT